MAISSIKTTVKLHVQTDFMLPLLIKYACHAKVTATLVLILVIAWHVLPISWKMVDASHLHSVVMATTLIYLPFHVWYAPLYVDSASTSQLLVLLVTLHLLWGIFTRGSVYLVVAYGLMVYKSIALWYAWVVYRHARPVLIHHIAYHVFKDILILQDCAPLRACPLITSHLNANLVWNIVIYAHHLRCVSCVLLITLYLLSIIPITSVCNSVPPCTIKMD